MDGLTHLIVGLTMGQAFFGGGAVGAFAAFMAVFPDFDTIAWLIPRLRGRIPHRGPTHSLLVGAVASLAGALILALLGKGAFFPLLAAGLVGFLSHVGLDFLNWGCALLWPWTPASFHWTVQRGLVGPFVASALAALALLATRFVAPDWLVPLAWAILAAGALYLAFRAGSRRLVERHAGRAANVVPTGHPLEWRAYGEEAADTLRTVRSFRYRLGSRPVPVAESRYRIGGAVVPLATADDAVAYAAALPQVERLRRALGPLHVSVRTEGEEWRLAWWTDATPWREGIILARVSLTRDGRHSFETRWLPRGSPTE